MSFNPHPVFRPGDAKKAGDRRREDQVSIRTRSFDRVMHDPAMIITAANGFQSAPGLSTG